jgi:Flp pilus assembly pilin Flp
MSYFVDMAALSLNKAGEELCGDKVEHFRTEDGMIVVLADGLGSGVKANILATLTSKIAITMLKQGADIEEVVDTIAHTLPVCSVRKLAYSTFTIIKIFNDGEAYIVQFDNPGVFFIRDSKIMDMPTKIMDINNRKIKESRFKVEHGDIAVIVSDGVIHAGAGKTINLGWQWDNVAKYLEELVKKSDSPNTITNDLVGVCEDFYLDEPGDDTTVVTLKIRKPEVAVLFSGPPENKENDASVVNRLIENKGKKIVCGGTAANIVARELQREIKSSFNIIDRRVPPIAEIEGIDLVTEGVLTLKVAIEKLRAAKASNNDGCIKNEDGASKLARILTEDCTHLKMLVGKAINPAHQNPDFPQELSIKLNVIEDLKNVMEELDKIVSIEYF